MNIPLLSEVLKASEELTANLASAIDEKRNQNWGELVSRSAFKQYLVGDEVESL